MIEFDWITADQHYSHARVILYCNRPFAPEYEMLQGSIGIESSMRMNEALIENHNKLVKPGETVLHLGDFSMGLPALKILSRLNGEHHLTAGNHDKVHPISFRNKIARGEDMRKIYYEAGFKSICLEEETELAGKRVLLNHFPYWRPTTSAHDQRFDTWRPKDTGLWLLHGHIHQHQKYGERTVNVGVDVWNYAPAHRDEISAHIEANS